MERAQSAPPEGAVKGANPFWSAKVREDLALAASRPVGLPTVFSPAEPLPVRDVLSSMGKGRGVSSAAAMGAATGVSFATPPSRHDHGVQDSGWREGTGTGTGVLDPSHSLQQTEGVMPPETEIRGPQTMGRVPTVAEEPLSGVPAGSSTGEVTEIQRALEKEIVIHLREQNARLLAELDELRQSKAKSSGDASFSSWSEVGQDASGPQGRKECHTPRAAKVTQDSTGTPGARFTPNGTKVPTGTPPTDEPVQPPPMPSGQPPVPPFPLQPVSSNDVQQFLDGYDATDCSKRVKRSDVSWSPKGEMTPRRARAFWLQQELKALHQSIDKSTEGHPFRSSEYFSQRFEPPVFQHPEAACAGIPGPDHQVRASQHSAVLGTERHQGRAFLHSAELGDECPRGRAGMSSSVLGAACHQVRAGMSSSVLGADCHQVRAGAGLADHGLDRLQVRAGGNFEHGGQGLHDRAESVLGFSDHLRGDHLRTGPGAPSLHPGQDDRFCRVPGHGVEGGGRREEDKGYGPIPSSWTGAEGGGSDVPRSYKVELPDLMADASPLQFGDWLHLCGPAVHDISGVAGRWWELTTRQAKVFYDEWKNATPLARVQLEPRLPDELLQGCYSRTEQRGVSMLLRAICPELQQMLVTDRQLHSTAILYRLYVRYQPGGPGEKSIILQQLIGLPKCPTINDLAAALRSWRRHYGRAREVDASLPDPTLLIKALEPAVLMISKEDAQASFRLAQSRAQLDLDARPTTASIWSFSQCLLAEAETMVLMSATTTSTTPIKIKQMESTSSPTTPNPEPSGKGKGGSTADTPCKWFRSDGGCRAGRSCKWSHAWDNIPDKNARCWVCGSKEHRKNDCKLKGGGSSNKTSKDEPKGSGGGNGHGGKSAPKTSSPATTTPSSTKPAIQEMSTTTSTATTAASPEGEGNGAGGGEKVKSESKDDGGKSASHGAAELLQEATQLLKALRGPSSLPTVKVMQIASLEKVDRNKFLLDSGATHALRPAQNLDEWSSALATTVQLAQGETGRFRLKAGTKILLTDPQVDEDAAWIIPMGGLAELGYVVEWKGNQCDVRDPSGQSLLVQVQNGCPMLSHQDGLQVLQLMETYQLRQLKKLLVVKLLMEDPTQLRGSLDLETALTLKLQNLFPSLPAEVVGRVVPDLDGLQSESLGATLPWNRRKRRRLERSSNVVLHLFSGPDQRWWEKQLSSKTTEVLCVDICGAVKANLHDANVFKYLLMLAASGKLRAILGGPPCRTVSALRYQQDGGPREVRSEEWPYGLPGQTPAERELVVADSVLFFRFLLLYMVAEEVRDVNSDQTTFLCEQPQDPKEYRSAEDVQKYQYMSVWRTKEWKAFAARYGLHMVNFDQGVMGHAKRKPTTVATNLTSMLDLQELRGDGSQSAADAMDRAAKSLQDRCEESRTWSAWAPGLKAAIAHCLQQQRKTWDGPQNNKDDGIFGVTCPKMKPLGPVALEQWKQHFLHDHLPARRDCAHCVRAQARSKPHKRVSHPEAYTLSVDLSGRLVPGRDQGNKTAKYIMVAVYTFPVTLDGKPLLEPVEPQDQPLPHPDACANDEDEADPNGDVVPDAVISGPQWGELDAEGLDEPDDAPLPGLDDDDENDGVNEGGDGAGDHEAPAEAAAKSAYETWHKLATEASNVAVKNLTFIEILESRASRHVLPALARIHCRLRSLGLPILRLHTDRARELIGAPVRRWTMARSIIPTMTTGNNFKSNGRAEAEVQMTKKAIRAVIDATQVDVSFWPMVARHVGERRLRHQLTKVGWPASPMLRFGTKAYAVKKSWKDRYQDWRRVREEVQVYGPDIYSSLTSPAYYVRSLEDGRFFYTDDLVIAETELPAAAVEDAPVYMIERGDEPAPVPWNNRPNRRITGKQTVPVVSMLSIEGEKLLVQRFPLLFEPSLNIPATLKQTGKRPAMIQLVAATDPDAGQSSGSDSWTLGTISSGAVTEVDSSSGGGEKAEAPNSWCGGSSPAASKDDDDGPGPSSCPAMPAEDSWRQIALRTLQFNLSEHIAQEMDHLDATTSEQGLWIPALNEAMLQKAQLEEELHGINDENEANQLKAIEEEFLVTRTVGNQEVWQHLEDWTPSVKKEYDQLVNQKKAVRQITREELRRLSEETGRPIELLPGKMVHTRKAVSGDYRSRAVVCGNFSEATSAECYAGGADGTQIRAAVKCAALKNWQLAATDIRVAFLNAPRRDQTKIVAMEVPRIFRQISLAGPEHVWLIEKALYGLTTSPRDWGLHRNEELPRIRWNLHDEKGHWVGQFKKTEDENLWRLEECCQESGATRWVGLLSVYVDDLLAGGEKASVAAALEAVGQLWSLAEVEWAEVDTPLKFCGFEIHRDGNGDGYHLSQQRYEREMLQRWEVTEGADYPVFKVTEDDDHLDEPVDPNLLRKAQAVAGSLLWLTTRTRPDILNGVSTMSRLMSKNPAKALQIGQALLKYIHKVPGGLHFSGRAEGWGSRDQLKVQRDDRLIEVFSDISYAAGSGHRSIEGVIGFFAGSPLVWQCHQQPFATHSTAEAELVSYCESLIAGRSLEALLCTMWGESNQSFKKVIYGDNTAAISLAHGTANSSWRTRHLRIRASVLREALEQPSSYPGGSWLLLHLKGTELVADGLTKPLQGQAFDRFLEDLGMRRQQQQASVARDEDPGAAHGGVPANALLALVLGSSLLGHVEASSPDDEDREGDVTWICGLCLIALGTVYACELSLSFANCVLRRLWVSSSETAARPAVAEPSSTGQSDDELPTTSRSLSRSSGSRMASSSTSHSAMPPSGFSSGNEPVVDNNLVASLEQNRKVSQRISSAGSMSLSSGSQDAVVASGSMSSSSGMQAAVRARAVNSRSMTSSSGSQAAVLPNDEYAAARAAASSSSSSSSGAAAAEPLSEAEGPGRLPNPWNIFQHNHKGQGLNSKQLARLYRKQKKS